MTNCFLTPISLNFKTCKLLNLSGFHDWKNELSINLWQFNNTNAKGSLKFFFFFFFSSWQNVNHFYTLDVCYLIFNHFKVEINTKMSLKTKKEETLSSTGSSHIK